MNIFYGPDAVLKQPCQLDETESRHIATVLRHKQGDEIAVFDGHGNLYSGPIIGIGKKDVTVLIDKLVETTTPGPRLHIAIAPPKNIERLEWFTEKVTEIGVSEITPLICQRSERRELRTDRLVKVLLSACKQSMKYVLPIIHEPVKFDAFVSKEVETINQKLMAWCDEKSTALKNTYTKGSNAIVLIGPEGDFTDEEVQLAKQNGYTTVSLGKSRLRLETAGIYAATVFNVINE